MRPARPSRRDGASDDTDESEDADLRLSDEDEEEDDGTERIDESETEAAPAAID